METILLNQLKNKETRKAYLSEIHNNIECPIVGATYKVSVNGYMVFCGKPYLYVVFTNVDGHQKPVVASFLVGRSKWNGDIFPGFDKIDGLTVTVTDCVPVLRKRWVSDYDVDYYYVDKYSFTY